MAPDRSSANRSHSRFRIASTLAFALVAGLVWSGAAYAQTVAPADGKLAVPHTPPASQVDETTQAPAPTTQEEWNRHVSGRLQRFGVRAASQARREGMTGNHVVHVRFIVARDGTLTEAKVDKSSGSPMADRTALDVVHRASPFHPFPQEMENETQTLIVPLVLRFGAAPQTATD